MLAAAEKKEVGVPDGMFTFETPRLIGRGATLGAVSFTITGQGRVKNSKGALAEANVPSAKAETMQAVTSAVGKAVNAGGVTSAAGQFGALSDQARGFAGKDKGLSAKNSKAGAKGAKGPELWCMLIEKAWAVHKGTYTGIEGGHVNDDGKFGGAIALLTNLKEGRPP